jgi:accessory colonization factor AcfC
MIRLYLCALLLASVPALAAIPVDAKPLASLPNVAQPAPNIVTAGRLSAADIPRLVSTGIRHVIDLTADGETPDFDEAAAVRAAGLKYYNLPIRGAEDLTPENVARFDRLMIGVGGEPTLVHCSSSNRVGAMAALRAAWSQGQATEAAVAEGRRWGLKGLEPAVRERLTPAALHVYGPGGPAPAMKEAAAAFSKARKVKVEVTTGPTPEWKAQADKDAEVIFSGSESMMTDFLTTFPDLDPKTVMPLYLRPSAILVRPGNPKRIKGIQDLLTPGRRILVVQGSGQGGLWEDVAGRLGDIRSVRAMRNNIVEFASNSGEAKQTWQADPSLDAWLIWNIWEVANPTLADVVEIEPQYRIYRDAGVALTRRGRDNPQARAFANFLASAEGAAIFAKWGWVPSAPVP